MHFQVCRLDCTHPFHHAAGTASLLATNLRDDFTHFVPRSMSTMTPLVSGTDATAMRYVLYSLLVM